MVTNSNHYYSITLQDKQVFIDRGEKKQEKGAIGVLELLALPNVRIVKAKSVDQSLSIAQIASQVFNSYMKKLGCWRYVNRFLCLIGKGNPLIEKHIEQMQSYMKTIEGITNLPEHTKEKKTEESQDNTQEVTQPKKEKLSLVTIAAKLWGDKVKIGEPQSQTENNASKAEKDEFEHKQRESLKKDNKNKIKSLIKMWNIKEAKK